MRVVHIPRTNKMNIIYITHININRHGISPNNPTISKYSYLNNHIYIPTWLVSHQQPAAISLEKEHRIRLVSNYQNGIWHRCPDQHLWLGSRDDTSAGNSNTWPKMPKGSKRDPKEGLFRKIQALHWPCVRFCTCQVKVFFCRVLKV